MHGEGSLPRLRHTDSSVFWVFFFCPGLEILQRIVIIIIIINEQCPPFYVVCSTVFFLFVRVSAGDGTKSCYCCCCAAAAPSLSHKDSSYAWLLQKINYSNKHLDFVLFIKKCHDAQPKGFKGLFLGSTRPQNTVSSRVILPRSLDGWTSEQLQTGHRPLIKPAPNWARCDYS